MDEEIKETLKNIELTARDDVIGMIHFGLLSYGFDRVDRDDYEIIIEDDNSFTIRFKDKEAGQPIRITANYLE